MSVFESIERFPVEYLPTGDHALLVAWAIRPTDGFLAAVLCLEDGRAVIAGTEQFKFDYRFSTERQAWVDVSRISLEGEDADPNQENADHGSPEVQGQLPESDRVGESDPGDG